MTKTEDTYLLSGLQPKTEYIMYLVTTTGTSGIFSPVTAYRFKTEDVTKPILWTQAANTVATINTTIDATVAYKLLQYDTTNHHGKLAQMVLWNMVLQGQAEEIYSPFSML